MLKRARTKTLLCAVADKAMAKEPKGFEAKVTNVEGIPFWFVHEYDGKRRQLQNVWRPFDPSLSEMVERCYGQWANDPDLKWGVAPRDQFKYTWKNHKGEEIEYRFNFDQMKQERDDKSGVFERDIKRMVLPDYSLGYFLSTCGVPSELERTKEDPDGGASAEGLQAAFETADRAKHHSENSSDLDSNSDVFNFVDLVSAERYMIHSDSDPNPSGSSTPAVEPLSVLMQPSATSAENWHLLVPGEDGASLEKGPRVWTEEDRM